MKLDLEQIEWLNICTEGTWKLNPDTGLVDIDGSFDCSEQGLTDFKGVRFGTVSGYFDCDGNRLTSLVGSPESVGGDFFCSYNQLSSLDGAPESVEGYFYCYSNQLTSLVGAPVEVGGHFICSYNQLISLEGAPESIGGNIYCSENLVSEETLLAIYKLMKRRMSYTASLLQYWNQMPEEDKLLMYRDNPYLADDKRREYELRYKVRGISI